MSFTVLCALFAAAFVNAALPGPCVILTLGRTARSGVRAGLVVSGGILASDLVLVIVGIAATTGVVAVAPAAFPVMKWLGIACLAMLGARSIAAAWRPRSAQARTPIQDGIAGAVVGLSSPYNLIFYLALFPQVFPAQGWELEDALVTGATVLGAIALAQVSIVAFAACCRGAVARHGAWIDYATAVALFALAGVAAAVPPVGEGRSPALAASASWQASDDGVSGR